MSASLSELASLLQEETNVIDNKEEEASVEDVLEEEGEESQEEVVEESTEGETEAASEEDVDETLEQEATETTSEESETYFPETLDDLVEAYDGNKEALNNLYVASKKNGERVSLGQVLANWEISESATRKSQEASELKKALEQEKQQSHAALAKTFEEQEAVLEALENLYKTAGSAELEQLRVTDKAEYAARMAEFNERDRILAQVKSEILSKKETTLKEQQKDFQDNYAKYVEDQNQHMLDLIPEWRNADTFNKEFQEIASNMARYGFNENEIGGVVDARLRKMARDAMLYNRIATTADPKKKRVVKKPKKVVRAGNTNKNVKDDAFKRRMNRAAKTPRMRDKTGAVAELIFNS